MEVNSLVRDRLGSCPTERYLFVTQANLNLDHMRSTNAIPQVQRTLKSDQIRSTVRASEMVSAFDSESMAQFIKDSCNAAGKKVHTEVMNFKALPVESSADSISVLEANDNDIGVLLQQYAELGDFTVVYTGVYDEYRELDRAECEDDDRMLASLEKAGGKTQKSRKAKRSAQVERQDEVRDTRPLFQKYQFFTPGRLSPNA
jgi:hypothetical protein